MGLSHLLQTFHNGGSVARIIQPQVPNYKINRTSNQTLMHAQREIVEYIEGDRKDFTIKKIK